MRTAKKRTSLQAQDKQAAMVATAEFRQRNAGMPDFMRAAYDYERTHKAVGGGYSSKPHLDVGNVIRLLGSKYVVLSVNPSRAMCVPINSARVSVKSIGERVEFMPENNVAASISPNSEVDVLDTLTLAQLRDNFSGNAITPTAGIQMSENKTDTQDSSPEIATQEQPKQRKGKRSEQPKSKSELNPIGAPVLPSGHISLAGRSDFIKALVQKGERDLEVVMKKVREKWPTHCSRAHIGKAMRGFIAKIDKSTK